MTITIRGVRKGVTEVTIDELESMNVPTGGEGDFVHGETLDLAANDLQ